MYRQILEEHDPNIQEVNRRSPCQTGTSHRPYTSPISSRRNLNGVYVSSEGRIDELGNERQRLYDPYNGRISSPISHSTPMNPHFLPSNYAEYEYPRTNINVDWTSNRPSDIMMAQGDPRSHPQNYSTCGYNESQSQQSGTKSLSPQKQQRSESIIEWFDRTVEAELEKRHTGSANVSENVTNVSHVSHPNVSHSNNPLFYEASTAGIDIERRLHPGPDTDLLDAVDKLAKAEAMVAFEGAVKAAEKAAAGAPPELAEEAAVAGAKDFQAELTGLVQQEFPGVKPIEVIGYVGITRPKKPKKSNFVNNKI